MNNGKTKAGLYAAAAVYLFYLAYQLFVGRNNPDGAMSTPLMVLFIALFVIAAVFLLFYAWRMWKHAEQEEKEKQEENQPK